MTLDENLVKQVDAVVKKLGTTRSAFTRKALTHEIEAIHIAEMEKKHIAGYKKNLLRKMNLMFGNLSKAGKIK